jgi:PHD/YefM family antitoxin component YafN of YafNO toxin-antitoxin module
MAGILHFGQRICEKEASVTIKTLDSGQAHSHWQDLLDLALTADTDVVITRHKKPIVAVVAYEDYLAVSDLLSEKRAARHSHLHAISESRATLYASERVLARDWDTPEEDEAWADL